MKSQTRYFLILIVGLLFSGALLPALSAAPKTLKENPLGTTLGVEFYTIFRYDKDGHKYGDDLFARNTNTAPANVSIELTKNVNVIADLIEEITIVPPGKTLLLGSIVQDDYNKDYEWYVSWWVTVQSQ